MKKNIKVWALIIIVIGVFCFSLYPFFTKSEVNALANNNVIINFKYNNKKYSYNLYATTLDFFNPDIKRQLDKRCFYNSIPIKKNLVDSYLNDGFTKKEVLDFVLVNLNDHTEKICSEINKSHKNALVRFQPHSSPMFTFYKDAYGIEVDVDALYNAIYSNFYKGVFDINIPTKRLNPSVTEKELKDNTVLKCSFYTNYSISSEARKTNVRLALSKFDGMVIDVGKEVSFNSVVGERSEKNGYKTAKIIVGGKYVDGIGGGVCQASTTLYNACLYAGLKIVKQFRHSLQSSYVLPSFDAMVNSGSADMVFKNTTNYPLYIKLIYTNNDIGVEIYGEPNKYEVRLRSEVTKRLVSKETVVVDNEKKYIDKVRYTDEVYVLQESHDEVFSTGYREYYLNGKKVSEEFLRKDRYMPQEGIYIKGAEQR